MTLFVVMAMSNMRREGRFFFCSALSPLGMGLGLPLFVFMLLLLLPARESPVSIGTADVTLGETDGILAILSSGLMEPNSVVATEGVAGLCKCAEGTVEGA